MQTYNLAKLRADQPNLWPPLVLPACLLACETAPGTTSSFELAYFAPGANDPTIEGFSLVHAADVAAADVAALRVAGREDLLHVAAAGVITAMLRARDELRVARVSKRGPWLELHLQKSNGRDEGVLVAFGTDGADPEGVLADVVKHVNGAPGGRKIAGAVAFGGGKAAIRVLS
ncbi:hypothetical protein [Polyangium spumosum]|uniref:Uncharacterized protein n=1 Tax=Polyangium spumosum TaxID=889282 RepID=A0A6N7PZD6_9BACT|nr:hypothetical protein [Polyangium spumosum]MRG97363.1 hypothetical protein [Polyangium spumosum]